MLTLSLNISPLLLSALLLLQWGIALGLRQLSPAHAKQPRTVRTEIRNTHASQAAIAFSTIACRPSAIVASEEKESRKDRLGLFVDQDKSAVSVLFESFLPVRAPPYSC